MEQPTSWSSYPKIFQFGHGAVAEVVNARVLVEEKIDGSQFSFGLIDGRLRIKSHHQDISDIVGEYGLFTEAIAYVRTLHEKGLLHPGWTYRGEVLQRPCHNRLAYERVPKHHIVGFDVCTGPEVYLEYNDKCLEFRRLDLETVPYYYFGQLPNVDTIDTFLGRTPLLGGKHIEGVVFKAYGRYGEDKKTLMAKYVHPAFRETKTPDEYTKSVDFTQGLIDTYRSEARWDKAIQRLKEQGKLGNEPKDIGPLIGAITKDIEEECGDEIRRKLWKRYWPHVARGCTGGFAEYYKRKLMEGAFAQDSQAMGVQATTAVDGCVAGTTGSSEPALLGAHDPEPRPAATATTVGSA
jgi:hypothetical protein